MADWPVHGSIPWDDELKAYIDDADGANSAAINAVEGDVATLQGDVLDKADTDSPVFTGNPTAPTPSPGDDDTSIATTAFVTAAISAAAGVGVIVKQTIFTSDTTYSKAADVSAGYKYAIIEAVGGGGAGGGCASGGQASMGAGGGSGGYSRATVALSALATDETVDIGAGGTGVSNGTGGSGAQTSFGTIVIAKGGGGGAAASNSSSVALGPTGASGGSTSGAAGDVTVGGESGGNGIRLSGTISGSGKGGSSRIGPGGSPLSSTQDAAGESAQANTGAGGSGANTTNTNRAGGNGGSGVVIMTLFG